MGKLILFLSFVSISVLFVFGMLAPESSVMWLASTSSSFMILRVVMLSALVALLITNPPRNVLLRSVVGMLAISLSYWGISATYQNHMAFLDTMSILGFSISAGITVLERSYSQKIAAV